MHQKPNCKQISSAIKVIKSRKADFVYKLEESNIPSCFDVKADLLEMIKKLKTELWPFEQEELSIERLKTTYEQYKTLFESNGIVKNGKIPQELLPDELKGETFAMPTEGQFLEYIASKEDRVKEMVRLGLVEPVLVPIAADFGKDSVSGDVHSYTTGLLGVLAKEIRMLGLSGKLKGSDGVLLPTKAEWGNSSADPKQPIYVNTVYQNMRYLFKEKDGTFSESLTQKEFIEKHKDADSPFPGFAIYFKEKGYLLPRDRDEKDPLKEMTANREYQQYKESLYKLGLTGTTAHAELIMLLASLQKDGKVTRDWKYEKNEKNEKNVSGFLGGNTFQGSTYLGSCYWSCDDGMFCFGANYSHYSNSGVAGVPIGELV